MASIKEIAITASNVLFVGTLIATSTIIFSKAPDMDEKNLYAEEQIIEETGENKYINFRSDDLWKIIFELNKKNNPTPNNSELTKKLEEFKSDTEGWKKFKTFCVNSYSEDNSFENIEDFCADNLEIIKKIQTIALKRISEIKGSSENFEDPDLSKLKTQNQGKLYEFLSIWVKYCAKNGWGESNQSSSEKYCKFNQSTESENNLVTTSKRKN